MKISQGMTLLPMLERSSKPGNITNVLNDTNTSFGETLNKAIADVNGLQAEAGKAIDNMVAGKATDLHDVMIAVEKARTSFDLLMEIRNKTIGVYQEIMRIQV
jgi:flagellar hook-basal body complex protein FliE